MPGKPGPSHPDEIGRWSKEKLELLAKYLHAYSVIMAKQRERWLHAYHYVDAFAGAVQHRSKSAGLLAPQMTAQSSLLGPADAAESPGSHKSLRERVAYPRLEPHPPLTSAGSCLASWRADRRGWRPIPGRVSCSIRRLQSYIAPGDRGAGHLLLVPTCFRVPRSIWLAGRVADCAGIGRHEGDGYLRQLPDHGYHPPASSGCSAVSGIKKAKSTS